MPDQPVTPVKDAREFIDELMEIVGAPNSLELMRSTLPVVDGLTELDIECPITTFTGPTTISQGALAFNTREGLEITGTPLWINRGIINSQGFDFEVYASQVTQDTSEDGVVRLTLDNKEDGPTISVPVDSNVTVECITTPSTPGMLNAIPMHRISGTLNGNTIPVTLNHLEAWFRIRGISIFSINNRTNNYIGNYFKSKRLVMGDWGKGNDTWSAWNRAFQTTPAPVYNLHGPESTDQIRIRNEERAVAQARAKELLFSLLDTSQRRMWNKYKRFYLYAGENKYCIKAGRYGNVALLGKRNMILETYCCHPIEQVAPEDCVVAQMLMLQNNEKEFLRMANVHYTKKGFSRAA